METATITQTKTFAQEARAFLLSLMAQRRKLLLTGESRIEKRNAYDAIEIISRQLNAYEYSADKDMARFIQHHYNTISLILPGKGSSCHESRFQQLLNIYNNAVVINTSKTMNKYSFYRVSNDHGEGYIKTSASECWTVTLNFEGKIEIKQYDTCFRRFNGDVIVEITADQFKEGSRGIVDQLKKSLSL